MVSKRTARAVALALWAIVFLLPRNSAAFPDAEVEWSAGGGPPFDFGIVATTSGFMLMSDRRLAASYGEVLMLVDMGHYALEAEQPPALSSEHETDGIINGIAYNSAGGKIIASQEDGDVLEFALASITEQPQSLIAAEGDSLGPVVYDPNTGYAYVADNTSYKIIVVDTVAFEVVTTITPIVPGHAAFDVTAGIYVDLTQEIYFTTDVGALLYIVSGGTAATVIDIAIAAGNELSGLDELPNGSELYVLNYEEAEVVRVDTSTHSIIDTEIELVDNTTPTDIAITKVENPDGTYAYVAGASGVSVINTSTQEVLDMGDDPDKDHEPIPTSAEPYLVEASSVSDGIVYMNFSIGGVGLITENPVAAFTAITYSSGGSFMGQGESVDLTLMADQDGTYGLRVGGDVDASGSLLTDSTGATSGSLTFDTPLTVTVNYDDNSTLFDEGDNDVWIFVTNDTLRGRRATTVTVDTPPADVTVTSTGFGNGSIYINMDRIDVSDMSAYNVYVSTDPDAVLTMADVTTAAAQPDSGSSVTAEVSGLTNGTLYYAAVEAVDANGNKSPNRTSVLPDGSRITATPEETVGPAGLSGETGCGLAGGSAAPLSLFLVPLALILIAAMRRLRGGATLLIAALILTFAGEAAAQTQGAIEESAITPGFSLLEPTIPHWDIEVKTGFWMPGSSALETYFDTCCNLITRVQGGYMWQRRYGIEGGVGFLYKSGRARAVGSGAVSQDNFSFILVPMQLSFVWRADYFTWRYMIPYVKAGFDGIFYYESVAGSSVKGMKWGMHSVGGVQLNLSEIAKKWGDTDVVVREFFMTFEVEYLWVNSFGSGGLNLSGPVFSVGLLFYL